MWCFVINYIQCGDWWGWCVLGHIFAVSEAMKVFKFPISFMLFLAFFLNFSLVFFTPSNEDHMIYIKSSYVSITSPQVQLPHELFSTSVTSNGSYKYNNTVHSRIKVINLHDLWKGVFFQLLMFIFSLCLIAYIALLSFNLFSLAMAWRIWLVWRGLKKV